MTNTAHTFPLEIHTSHMAENFHFFAHANRVMVLAGTRAAILFSDYGHRKYDYGHFTIICLPPVYISHRAYISYNVDTYLWNQWLKRINDWRKYASVNSVITGLDNDLLSVWHRAII